MSSFKEMNDPLIVPGKISIPFSYSAGKKASRFLTELRDHKRILGVRCPSCGRIWAPAQGICVNCFTETEDWVELSGQGRLLTHTWIKKPKYHQPRIDPLIYGIIQLDGADNSMIHLVHHDDPESLLDGIKVRPVFAEDRRSHIFDIKYFRPVGPVEE